MRNGKTNAFTHRIGRADARKIDYARGKPCAAVGEYIAPVERARSLAAGQAVDGFIDLTNLFYLRVPLSGVTT